MNFITSTIDFIIQTRKSYPTFPIWPEYPLMQHKWGQKDLLRDETLVRYKDLHVKVTDKDKDYLLCVCKLRLTAIVQQEHHPSRRSKGDLKLDHIQWDMLVDYMQSSNNLTYEPGQKKIVFVHPYAGNRVVEISNQHQLQYAVKVLRAHGKAEILLQLKPRE